MEEFKGTKGKWFFRGSEYFLIESRIDGSDAVGTLPTIAIVNSVFIDSKEAKANARLIANAPELLKALQKIVDGTPPATDTEAWIWVDVAKDIANDAILKTLGKE